MRRFGLLAIALLAALATVAVTAQGSTPSTCTASQLKASPGSENGAAGTIVFAVIIRNTSHNSCSVRGYPALQMIGTHGRRLRTRVHHGGGLSFLDRPVRRITLAPGGAATVLVAYGDVPVGKEKLCPTGKKLLVTPPGAGSALSVAVLTQACGGGYLQESPLLAGVQHS
jgi:hypothetical protein